MMNTRHEPPRLDSCIVTSITPPGSHSVIDFSSAFYEDPSKRIPVAMGSSFWHLFGTFSLVCLGFHWACQGVMWARWTWIDPIVGVASRHDNLGMLLPSCLLFICTDIFWKLVTIAFHKHELKYLDLTTIGAKFAQLGWKHSGSPGLLLLLYAICRGVADTMNGQWQGTKEHSAMRIGCLIYQEYASFLMGMGL